MKPELVEKIHRIAAKGRGCDWHSCIKNLSSCECHNSSCSVANVALQEAEKLCRHYASVEKTEAGKHAATVLALSIEAMIEAINERAA